MMLPLKSHRSSIQTRKPQDGFEEERRIPLSNKARDAFLRELQVETHPTPAARAAVARYKSNHSSSV
jgi:hypothetical protein